MLNPNIFIIVSRKLTRYKDSPQKSRHVVSFGHLLIVYNEIGIRNLVLLNISLWNVTFYIQIIFLSYKNGLFYYKKSLFKVFILRCFSNF